MVIEVGTNEYEDRVIAAGQSIPDALGRDPTELSVLDALPSATEMGLSFCCASIDLKKPMTDVGRFFSRNTAKKSCIAVSCCPCPKTGPPSIAS